MNANERQESLFDALMVSEQLLAILNRLKAKEPERGRLLAIAATDVEKVAAWIAYVINSMPEEERLAASFWHVAAKEE